MDKPTKEQELQALEKQLKEVYLSISDRYKLKSKMKDNLRLDGIQTGIDHELQKEKVLRAKIDVLRKAVADE